MLGHRHHKTRARGREQPGPGLRVEPLRLEPGDKILIAKAIGRPIGLDMVLILRRTGPVHVSGVPLVAKGRHCIQAPVDKNAEFGLLIPLRRPVYGGNLRPVRRKGALSGHPADARKRLTGIHCPSLLLPIISRRDSCGNGKISGRSRRKTASGICMLPDGYGIIASVKISTNTQISAGRK